MDDYQSYLRIISSVVAAVITLLGSVGIFVSLTVQRRVERLQDILEEFLDFSYHGDINITGKMYKLIEKYQMHYMFPDTPGRIILQYINLTILTVIISWLIILTHEFRLHWTLNSLIYPVPLLMAIFILIFYRHLLKNVIYPSGNNLMSPLIPPPVQLRSVSFLSRYVNVSVKSLLRQARLRLLIKKQKDGKTVVILKEELSFDDFLYYLIISSEKKPVFVAYGELKIAFGNEPVTGKPIPVAKNVNIPLGYVPQDKLTDNQLEARFFIFPRGEKHPLEYIFNLQKQGDIITMSGDPEISINYMFTYQMVRGKFEVIEENAEIPFFKNLVTNSVVPERRFYCCTDFSRSGAEMCTREIYID
ncbi:MAG TPA: hypothetical protein VNT57_02810 [Desulfobacteria bacterium]|nr:hypothetical protein [Desulfobacteria bacterium]